MEKSCFNGAGPVAAASGKAANGAASNAWRSCCNPERELTFTVLLLLYHFSLKINSSRGEAKKTDCTSVTICAFLHFSSCFSKLFQPPPNGRQWITWMNVYAAARHCTRLRKEKANHLFVSNAKPMIKSLVSSSARSVRMLATNSAVAAAKSADVKFFQSGHARTILLDRPSALNAINM